jgi:hypothetical protein
MLERSGSFTDWTEHHLQEIQEISPCLLVAHLISEPSLGISPIWTPIIDEEVGKLKLCPI